MLVVISSENTIDNEAAKINELFKNGLENFHLRKPNLTQEEVLRLLNNIEPKFYKNIALHQYHFMAKEFGINRIHLNSKTIHLYQNFSLNDFVLTCSIHSVQEYNNLPNNILNYCFLSPVFNSISKRNYLAKEFKMKEINKEIKTKIIALGGINQTNCKNEKLNGFNGIALLGGVWNKNPVESFLRIKEKYIVNLNRK